MPERVAIVGGGLSGLAAAVAAADRGCRVELFERAKTLGGRAGSFVDTPTGQRVDYCRHVAMGCCTQFLEFCRRADLADCFERTNTLHFIGPDGRRSDFSPNAWLPAPWHLLPAMLRWKLLSPGERCQILRTLFHLTRSDSEEETVAAWLRRRHASAAARERFWSPILVSALGETIEYASLAAARKVFREGFMASREAGDLLLPKMPLGEIFHDRLGRRLAGCGVQVHLNAPIQKIEGHGRRAMHLLLSDGPPRTFDRFIVAVPWRQVRSLLAESLQAEIPLLGQAEKIEPAAITAVHLWFDRCVIPLRHAAMVGKLSQWVFTQPSSGNGEYCQVVVSASHRLPKRRHREWLADVLDDLQAIWPKVSESRLLHSRVITERAALFSVQPGIESLRPTQQTRLENLALAGDWTATDWPATMESAVRSGYRAVQALLND